MGKYRTRSPEDVVEEIKTYVTKGIKHFTFNDLLINGDVFVLEEMCDKIIKERLNIDWIANAIPMKNLTKKRLRKMKNAGCNTLMFGVETGSERVLKDMGKYFTVKDAKKVLRNSRKIGITTWVNFMVGYPTEQKEDFQKTLRFVEKNRRNISKICVANMCGVMYNSKLMDRRKEYDVVFPEDDAVTEIMWYTKDKKNTYEIRRERLKIMLQKFKELDLEVHQHNLNDWEQYYKEKKMSFREVPYEKYV